MMCPRLLFRKAPNIRYILRHEAMLGCPFRGDEIREGELVTGDRDRHIETLGHCIEISISLYNFKISIMLARDTTQIFWYSHHWEQISNCMPSNKFCIAEIDFITLSHLWHGTLSHLMNFVSISKDCITFSTVPAQLLGLRLSRV